jgi:hypothetical protein
MANKEYQALSLQPTGSMTKMRAEQIKSEDGLGSLAIDLEALRGQVKDIIGGADYKEEITGEYAKVQIVDLAAHIDASGATELSIKQDIAVVGSGTVAGTFEVDGQATMASLNVEDLTSGRVVFAGASGELVDSANLAFDGTDLTMASAKVSDLTATHIVYAGADGALVGTGSLAFDGSDLIVPSAKVSDLTATRVVYAGADGALVDDANMTYGSSILTVNGSTFGADVVVANDLTVTGDFIVQGTQTILNTSELVVEDKLIVIASGAIGAALDGAGFALVSDAGDKKLTWNQTNARWEFSHQMFAPSGSFGNLQGNIRLVQHDASGKLINAAAADYVTGTLNRVSVTGNANGTVTLSGPQDIHIGASPEFVKAKFSSLTATRLMASDADKNTVSVANLASWVAGTANQISVADDADGTITLSLPQSIHTDADVEFDSLVLGDLTANRMVKTNAASGLLVSADIMDFVTGTVNQVQLAAGAFGNVVLSLPQDIHTGASPQFAQVKLDGSDNYVDSSGEGLVLHAGLAGDSIVFEYDAGKSISLGTVALSGFTATTIMGALNELKATASASSKKATHTVGAGGFAADAAMQASLSSNFLDELSAANAMIFVNGQLMIDDSDFTLDEVAKTLAFKFALQEGDVVVVQKA